MKPLVQQSNPKVQFYQYSAQKGNPAAQIVVGMAHMYPIHSMEQNSEVATMLKL